MARKSHNKRKGGRRPDRKRKIKKTLHILCEGENTEPDYFNAFPVTNIAVKCIGFGQQHTKLVETAIAYRKREGIKKSKTDDVWVVFDYDYDSKKASTIKQDFNNAIRLAEQEGIKHATSNDCFELWYVLHYLYTTQQNLRTWYYKKLSDELGFNYSKDKTISKQMYEILEDKQLIAIKNSQKLEEEHKDEPPADKNPYTGVYKLVLELNKYRRKD